MKILLVDDHKLFCKSLKVILEMNKEMECVDICTEVEQLYSILQEKQYDIILLDINLGKLSDENGLEIAKRLLKEFPKIRIVILTGHNKTMYEYEAMKIGAKGFIDKETEPELLLKYLNDIIKGDVIFDIEVCDTKNGKKVVIRKQESVIEELTQREREILKKIHLGIEIEEISKEINISRRTIFNHLGNIYQKLGVENKQEAIYKAEKLGYFAP